MNLSQGQSELQKHAPLLPQVRRIHSEGKGRPVGSPKSHQSGSQAPQEPVIILGSPTASSRESWGAGGAQQYSPKTIYSRPVSMIGFVWCFH